VLRATLAGLTAGFVFGVVLVWEGADAAGLVLLFTLVGLLIGVVICLGWRVIKGELDTETIRRLAEAVFRSSPRDY
jgi:xanthosine utilization system XapX-like protein